MKFRSYLGLITLIWIAITGIYLFASAPNRPLYAQAELLFLPVVVEPGPSLQARLTPRPESTPTVVPAATATPSPTPVEVTFVQFDGLTNQGRSVLVEVLSDLSLVTKFEMDAQIVCPNSSGTVTIQVANPAGFVVTNRAFQIVQRTEAGNEHQFRGSFAADGLSVQGTWLIWFDDDLLQPCNDKGVWSASQMPS